MATEIAVHPAVMANASLSSKWATTSHGFADEPDGHTQLSNDFTFPPRENLADSQPNPVDSELDASSEFQLKTTNEPEPQRRAHQGRRVPDSSRALPAFQFNPGNTTANEASISPQTESPPDQVPSSPTRSVRHRRSTSEFVGADTPRSRASSVRSNSPNKAHHDGPKSEQEHQPARRGHRHRRSGAMSSSDLSTVLAPALHTPTQTSVDAPPLGPLPEQMSPNSLGMTRAKANTMHNLRSLHEDVKVEEPVSPQPRSPSRIRVGFSDALEFIPRPISFVSSESGSSMSTIREPSMAENLSSVLSGVSPTKIASSKRDLSRKSLDGGIEHPPRPKSADSAMGKVNLKPAIKLFDGSYFPRPKSAGASADEVKVADSTSTSVHEYLSRLDGASKAFRRRSRFGEWASNILRSNEKPDDDEQQSTPRESLSLDPEQPTVEPFPAYDDNMGLNVNFDEEDPTGTVIDESTNQSIDPVIKVDNGVSAAWSSSMNLSVDSNNLDIDLDAALEPFTGSDGAQNASGLKGQSFSAVRHRLHSSGFQISSVDFAKTHHRRAESAPQLIPIAFDRPGMRQLASCSASEKGFPMEKVFEEDEEESQNSTPVSKVKRTSDDLEVIGEKAGTDVEDGMTDESNDMPTRPVTQPSSLANRRAFHRRAQSNSQAVEADHAKQLYPLVTNRPDNVKIVPYDGSIESSEVDHETGSPNTTSMTMLPAVKDSEIAQDMPLNPPRPISLNSSSLSYPTTPSSRRNSAKDSLNAYRFENSRFPPFAPAESGQDLRLSIDDVPSLISSRSTITSGCYAHLPSASSPSFVDPASSTASLPSVPSTLERHRKRPSMASLTRLMGASSIGSSKLSVQQSVQPGDEELPSDSKDKKRKRLTRVLKFWKAGVQ